MPPDGRRDGPTQGRPRPGDVYFEFQKVGNAVKVAAVDAATGLEVVVMGPLSASQSELQRVALAKLNRQLAKAGKG